MGYIQVPKMTVKSDNPYYITDTLPILKEKVYAPTMVPLSSNLHIVDNSYKPTYNKTTGIATNFSNYAGYQCNNSIMMSGVSSLTNLEAVCKFKITDNYSSRRKILHSEKCFSIEISSSNIISVYNWSTSSWSTFGTALNTNTWYWVKFEIDSSYNKTISLSTDGTNYTILGTYSDTTDITNWTYPVRIGLKSNENAGGFYNGEVDMGNTYLKINGNTIFEQISQVYTEYYDNTEGGNQ